MPARKSNLHPIAVLQPAPLKWVLKLQRINRTIVVVARIPDFAAYITDGGEDWAAAVVSVDIIIMKRSAGKIQSVCERKPFSTQATRYAWCGQVQINVEAKTDVPTYVTP